ncbi:hypothetical protein QRX60_00205 [Amycolatopsis mongoliensis]|uniref:Uncharacterized protein n=1 Tax=Amycolatopsis mongoliensis TaxID=715475 RepID=A0A9Y2JRP3_9PSEU|nr:hypothetical protein [Amycolatopsis sp. 4-36]WIY02334.1 hypothetical protein QRX60_00205 [Amycolatopsis sp. 4-36]
MRLVRLERQQSRVADDVRAALASLGRGSTVIGGIALVGVGSVTERPIEAVVLLPHGVIIVIGVDLPDPALRLEAPLGAEWKADGWPLVADDDAINPATEALDVSQACERRIASLVPGTGPVGTIVAVGPYVETVDQPAGDLAGPVRVLHPTPTTMLAATVSLATAHRPRSVDQVRALIRGLAPEAPEFSDEVLLGEGFSRFTDDSPPESLWDSGPAVPSQGGAAAAGVAAAGGAGWQSRTPVPAGPEPVPAEDPEPASAFAENSDSAAVSTEDPESAELAAVSLENSEPAEPTATSTEDPEPENTAAATENSEPGEPAAAPTENPEPTATSADGEHPEPGAGSRAAEPVPEADLAVSSPHSGDGASALPPDSERTEVLPVPAQEDSRALPLFPGAAAPPPLPGSARTGDDSSLADDTERTENLGFPAAPGRTGPRPAEPGAAALGQAPQSPKPERSAPRAVTLDQTSLLLPEPATAGRPQPFPTPRPAPRQAASTSKTVRWLPLAAIGLLIALVVAAIAVATSGDDTAAAPTGPPTPATQPPPSSTTAPAQSLQFALRAADRDQRCASHAFGDAQASLQQTSCSGVRRASYAATVDGRAAAVTVGIVEFPDAAQAAAFKAVADTPGGGGILDLASETGKWGATPPPQFENAAYTSRAEGTSVRIVQAVWAPGPSTPDDPGLARAAKAALDLPAQ